MDKSRTGVWINEQDEKMFRYLYDTKGASAQQIQREIYPKHVLRAVNNRLAKMISQGFVRATQHRSMRSRMVYFLSPVGFREFIKSLGGEDLMKELQSKDVPHDLDLVDIRRHFESQKGVVGYWTENMILMGACPFSDELLLGCYLNPDAALILERNEKKFNVVLEYERTRKYSDRYKSVFRKYYNSRVAAVLFVCKNEALLKRIRRIEKSTIEGSVRKIYYSDFSKWKSGQPCQFTNLNGAKITLQPMTAGHDYPMRTHWKGPLPVIAKWPTTEEVVRDINKIPRAD